MADLQGWKYLSLTAVHIPPTTYGKLMGFITLFPLYVICALSSLSLFNAHAFTVLLGILINECINYFLKHSFKHPRPNEQRSGYGMPSSHAQFMSFFFMSSLALIYLSKSFNYALNARVKRLIVYLCFCMSLMVSYSRVYLHYHSVDQVAVGYVIGLITAMIYYRYVSQSVRTMIFPIFHSILKQISQ